MQIPSAPWSHLFAPGCSPEIPLPILDEATRPIALQRTADTVRKLDEIRRAHDLPPDGLRLVLEVYMTSAREVTTETASASIAARTARRPLQLVSLDASQQRFRLLPRSRFDVLGRPQMSSYLVEEIEIAGDSSRWLVHDIRIRGRSQFQSGRGLPIVGTQFRKGGIMSSLRLDPCPATADFILCVEYVGPEPEGEVFEATAVGPGVV